MLDNPVSFNLNVQYLYSLNVQVCAVYMYVLRYTWRYTCMYTCIHVRIPVYMNVYMCIHESRYKSLPGICIYSMCRQKSMTYKSLIAILNIDVASQWQPHCKIVTGKSLYLSLLVWTTVLCFGINIFCSSCLLVAIKPQILVCTP